MEYYFNKTQVEFLAKALKYYKDCIEYGLKLDEDSKTAQMKACDDISKYLLNKIR